MHLNPIESALMKEAEVGASLRLKGNFYPLKIKTVRYETRDAAILVFDVPS